jgi:hypothetical protein
MLESWIGYNIRMKKFVLAVLLTIPFVTLAHDGGLTYEVEADGYFIDIGYTADLTAGEPVRFDLSIFKEKGGMPLVFSDAWIRVSGKTLLFAGPIAYGEFGKPGFTYVFPREGEYKISARFEDKGKELATAEFPLTIVGVDKGFDKRLLIELVCGMLLIVLTASTIFYFKKK